MSTSIRALVESPLRPRAQLLPASSTRVTVQLQGLPTCYGFLLIVDAEGGPGGGYRLGAMSRLWDRSLRGEVEVDADLGALPARLSSTMAPPIALDDVIGNRETGPSPCVWS